MATILLLWEAARVPRKNLNEWLENDEHLSFDSYLLSTFT